jgi:DNA-binding CsgD family transcriptional regulator
MKRPNAREYQWKDDKLIKKDVCFECGVSGVEIDYHHVIPLIKGGTQTIPLCLVCHGKIHDRDMVKHRELQRLGIERARKMGKYKGRNPQTKDTPEQLLSKPKSINILNQVLSGKTYDEISRTLPCSRTTIVKVVKTYREVNGVDPVRVDKRKMKRIRGDV